MKILLINEYFPPVAPGGAEWSVYYLAEALAGHGHKVGVVTVSHGPTPEAPQNVQIFAMPFPFRLAAGQKMYRQGLLENPFFHAAFSTYLGCVSRKFQPDVLHAQSKNALVASTVISRVCGIPIVYTLRDIGITCPFGMCFINGRDVNRCSLSTCLASCSDYLIEHYSPRRLWDQVKVRLLALALWPDTRLKQACMRAATERIAPSRGIVQSLPEKLRDGAISWTIIPHLPPSASNGHGDMLDEPVIPEGLPERFILYLGKISPGKGIHVMEQAIRQVADRHPDVSFVFAGKGRWTPPEGLPIQSVGSVNHATALKLIHASQCVVVPSIVPEAYNRVVLEAMNLGRPVVASDAGSLPEQVKNEETGLVVPRGSGEALAGALQRILSEPAMAQRYGENGKRWVQTAVSPESTLKSIEEVYQRVALKAL